MSRSGNEHLKEELRIKNQELKRMQAEKAKFEARLRHIVDTTTKVVGDLKEQIEAKNQALLARSETIRSLQEQTQQSPGAASASGRAAAESMDTGALDDLRRRNADLEERARDERREHHQIKLERDAFKEEIRRLRDQPEQMKKLKSQVQKLEMENKQIISKYELTIKDKENLISQFERAIKNKAGKRAISDDPLKILHQMNEELRLLEEDRNELKVRLEKERTKFNEKLKEEIEKIEQRHQDELNKMRMHSREKVKHSVEEIHEEGVGIWVLTFSDMITQLTAFFILLYALAAKNVQQFKEVILGDQAASIGALELLDAMEIKKKLGDMAGIKTKSVKDELQDLANHKTLPQEISITSNRSKVIVQMPGNTLFEPGRAALQHKARPALDEVIAVVNRYPEYKVNIQGHTDDSQISTPEFPTNWELSAARATAVLRYFIDKGIKPERLTATGFADIFPIAPNTSEEGRARNRRVEIVLEKERQT